MADYRDAMNVPPRPSDHQEQIAAYLRFTDSEGIVAEYRPLTDVRSGDRIVGGWRPWAVVKSVELAGGTGRVVYEDGAITKWFALDCPFPVLIFDPAENE